MAIDDHVAEVSVTRLVGRKPAVDTLLIRKFEQYDRLSDEERQVLERLVARTAIVGRVRTLCARAIARARARFSSRGLPDAKISCATAGARSQPFTCPADFVDLHSFLVKQMDHSVLAITPCVVGMVRMGSSVT
jgi:hypothetical protein